MWLYIVIQFSSMGRNSFYITLVLHDRLSERRKHVFYGKKSLLLIFFMQNSIEGKLHQS